MNPDQAYAKDQRWRRIKLTLIVVIGVAVALYLLDRVL